VQLPERSISTGNCRQVARIISDTVAHRVEGRQSSRGTSTELPTCCPLMGRSCRHLR
jgi:hypothetical protein